MRRRILVVNPNSSVHITAALSDAVDGQRDGHVAVDCVTLSEGPPGIASHTHKAEVVPPMQALIRREEGQTDAFVVACFGDPGLLAMREATRRPVFGMGECSFYTAMSLADRFGVISVVEASRPRLARYLRELGLTDRFAGSVAAGIPVVGLADDPARTLDSLCNAGAALVAMGAQAVITGCAGMAAYRAALASNIGVPVVEPTQAAVAMAAGILRSQAG
ncbi:aspartate/glutamate racemase family protein [Roseomonas sp. OT10]|uniref:aspartate/glutamate racemase family protein n=1 Tax=Roseomonas cutis TaxID=2897332 RepID=UPI001E62C27B|nr:aspartate/glutamate racemase family protein [Roseomonas sp. OT10]UFN48493.1 aspartate/glutamate racemase family protein [Roseomonas sp. OT10]